MPSLPRTRPDLAPHLLPDSPDSRFDATATSHAGPVYRVALQGFSDFECASLGSFFRLVSDRNPAYELAPGAGACDFIVADASHRASSERPSRTVYIGAGSDLPPDALACLPRPIDPVSIVRVFDRCVAELEQRGPDEDGSGDMATARHENGSEGGGGDTQEDSDEAATRARVRRGDRDGDPFYFEELAEIPIPLALTQMSLPLVHPPANWDERRTKDVLVVDDSAVALRFMETRLRRLGYRVYMARTSVHALELLAERRFEFVFLDVVLGPDDHLDGLQLCRQLKQRNRHPGIAAPVVIIVSARTTPEDRLRAEFAGCDAYLGKPMEERDLVNTLGRHDPTFGI